MRQSLEQMTEGQDALLPVFTESGHARNFHTTCFHFFAYKMGISHTLMDYTEAFG